MVMSCMIIACNPFKTGTPEPPDHGTVVYPQPTTPDNVLEIIALSMSAKDRPAYMDRLTPDFIFTPDPLQLDSDEFRNFPAHWGVVEEETYLSGLMSNADSLQVVWTEVISQAGVSGYSVTALYTLVAKTAGSDQRYDGKADFVMNETAGILYIRAWNDVVVSGSTTWGTLRASFLATGG